MKEAQIQIEVSEGDLAGKIYQVLAADTKALSANGWIASLIAAYVHTINEKLW